MEWSMAASGDGKNIMGSINDATIRLFDIPNSSADQLQTREKGAGRFVMQKA
jgi:hypothetical protein